VNDTRPSLPTLVTVGLSIALMVIAAAVRWVALPSGGDAEAMPVGTAADAVEETGPHGSHEAGFAVWGLVADGGPLRWDACRAIEVVLSPEGAPAGVAEDLIEAMARISSASGLRLRLIGRSEERPSAERPLVVREGTGWRWNPVLIAWMTPEEAREAELPLTPSDRGVALPVAVRDGTREGYVTGQIVLNAARSDLRPGFEDRADSWGATLLHEIGHLVGLAHVEDGTQLMAGDPGRGPVILGVGDLAGLAHIGAQAGCTDVPSPDAGRRAVRTPLTTP
jgi:hypothetical protein